MVTEGKGIDWGCGEALAFGSLVLEGTAVRLSGQDTRRGTFSHRHAILFDVEDGSGWVPLAHVRSDQAPFVVIDSMLSEYGCLGFEFGFSMADPTKLVVWEAQFGDFANGAQIVIDQFLSSAESKWQRMSGLVLLLPHGYEGPGPEHSRARPERLLPTCAEDNSQFCNSTPRAKSSHALRRQMHRTFRKPLVVMSPKSLLRHKAAVSSLDDFTGGRFQTVLADAAVRGAPEADWTLDPATVRRVLLCSGKIYYALLAGRRERSAGATALIRIEQLYPFPRKELENLVDAEPHAEQAYWVQEEPANMGALRFIEPLLRPLLDGRKLSGIDREPAASPATGSYKVHQAEEAELVQRAFARA